MRQICKHNDKRDIQRVIPGCSPDLNQAIHSGVIPDTATESQYNGFEELSDVGHRVREPFDVIEFDRGFERVKRSIEKRKSKK